MANFVITTNIIANNVAAVSLADSFDNLLVVSGVTVASTGSAPFHGIRMLAASQSVVIAGTVSGSTGVSIASTFAALQIADGGLLQGQNGILIDNGAAARVVNNGTIAAQFDGIFANGTLELVNAGLLSGLLSAMFLSTGGDRVVNTGTIVGDCKLSGGDDLFDTRAGITTGTIDLGTGNDTFLGGAGAERVSDSAGSDEVWLGGGDDTVVVAVDRTGDSFDGGDGTDALDLGLLALAARVNLDRGTLHEGDTGLDLVEGFEAVLGGVGADTLTGDDGDNTLRGRDGGDRLFGGGGNDRITGQAGRNLLDGGEGDDRLIGGAEADTLRGGAGDDYLEGSYDIDVSTGGTGADRFVWRDIEDLFAVAATGLDKITDFEHLVDLIDLSAIDAVAGGSDDAFTFVGAGPLTAAGQVAVRQTATATFIDISFFSAGAAGTIRLDGLIEISAADLVL